MNRYITSDLYEEVYRKALQTWKQTLQKVHQERHIYCDIRYRPEYALWCLKNISEAPISRLRFIQHRGPRKYIEYRNLLGHPVPEFERITHLNPSKLEEQRNLGFGNCHQLPPTYYYSNGSRPRTNGTFGFT